MTTKTQQASKTAKTTKRAAPAKTGQKSAEKPPKIGDYVRELIKEGKYNSEEIIQRVLKLAPNSAIDSKHIAWYCWKMKKDGELSLDFKLPRATKVTKPAAKQEPAEATPATTSQKAPPLKKKAAVKKKIAARRKTATRKKPASKTTA